MGVARRRANGYDFLSSFLGVGFPFTAADAIM